MLAWINLLFSRAQREKTIVRALSTDGWVKFRPDLTDRGVIETGRGPDLGRYGQQYPVSFPRPLVIRNFFKEHCSHVCFKEVC